MARPVYASILPSIKCSDCGADIEISMMGEHICSDQPDEPESHSSNTLQDQNNSVALMPSPVPAPLPPQASERLSALVYSPPPRQPRASGTSPLASPALASRPISPPVTEQVRYQQTVTQWQEPEPRTVTASSRIRQDTQPQTQRPLPRRSMTQPDSISARPESADLKLPQDSAFPIFPTTKKPFARQGAPPSLSLSQNLPVTSHTPAPPPVSPGLLKRFDTITKGPFGTRRQNGARDLPRSMSASAASNVRRDLRSGSISTPVAAPPTPIPLPPARPPRPEVDEGLSEALQGFGMNSIPRSPLPPVSEQPHQPDMFSDRPLPNAAQLPFKAPNAPGFGPEHSDSRSQTPDQATKALPGFTALHSEIRKPSHTSTTSSSSSVGSFSMFGSRTESSRSSHSNPFNLQVTLDSPQKGDMAGRDSPTADNKHVTSKSIDEEFAFGEPSPLLSQSSWSSYQHEHRQPFSHSYMTTSPDSLEPPPVEFPLRVASPPKASSHPLSLQQNMVPDQEKGPEQNAAPGVRRPSRTPKPKGDCRGCGHAITGKSIKAADGRLSGRYHRECFVCQTCKSPFDTAEFYVHKDNPFCAYHYHYLNQSLCQTCNTGIEGKYLETQPRKRYHLDCFSCHDCGKSLSNDYWEVNNNSYCEADAFRNWDKSHLLAPGRKFPERRTTKLMMM